MAISKIQREHFARMTGTERRAVIADCEHQINYIAFSETDAGKAKRAELQERIDFLSAMPLVRMRATVTIEGKPNAEGKRPFVIDWCDADDRVRGQCFRAVPDQYIASFRAAGYFVTVIDKGP